MIEVIPVMDIMSGVVVHAIAGKRNEYKPLRDSVISCSPKPEDVLKGFKKLGCRYVYIADLDAILGRGSNEDVIYIASLNGFTVLADIGRRGLERIDNKNILYVIGTEYIDYPDELNHLINRVISLDIKNRKVLFRNAEVDIFQASRSICSRGIKMVIVINLDLVGTLCGIDFDILRTVKQFCKTDIAAGGGLKSIEELKVLESIGIKYVLTATAIHRGIISECIY